MIQIKKTSRNYKLKDYLYENRKILSVLFAIIILAMAVVVGIGIGQEITNTTAAAGEFSIQEVTDQGLAYIGAGIAMIGAIGTGIGQGVNGARATQGVSRNPEAESKIRTMFIIGAGITESTALYALVVAILLIFVA